MLSLSQLDFKEHGVNRFMEREGGRRQKLVKGVGFFLKLFFEYMAFFFLACLVGVCEHTW